MKQGPLKAIVAMLHLYCISVTKMPQTTAIIAILFLEKIAFAVYKGYAAPKMRQKRL